MIIAALAIALSMWVTASGDRVAAPVRTAGVAALGGAGRAGRTAAMARWDAGAAGRQRRRRERAKTVQGRAINALGTGAAAVGRASGGTVATLGLAVIGATAAGREAWTQARSDHADRRATRKGDAAAGRTSGWRKVVADAFLGEVCHRCGRKSSEIYLDDRKRHCPHCHTKHIQEQRAAGAGGGTGAPQKPPPPPAGRAPDPTSPPSSAGIPGADPGTQIPPPDPGKGSTTPGTDNEKEKQMTQTTTLEVSNATALLAAAKALTAAAEAAMHLSGIADTALKLPDALTYGPGKAVIAAITAAAEVAPDPRQMKAFAEALPRVEAVLLAQLNKNEVIASDGLSGEAQAHVTH